MAEETKPVLDFWYEFASTYSYLSAMRIERLAEAAGVAVRWRPFLLGPIFAAQGWSNSPFNIYAAKGKYMWRDMERLCLDAELVFRRPDPFPQNGLLAARIALIGANEGWIADFSKAVYLAEFGAGHDISARETLSAILAKLGLDVEATLVHALGDDNKARLKGQTEEAQRLEIFGAPSFVTATSELFWGNDRLEQALDWA